MKAACPTWNGATPRAAMTSGEQWDARRRRSRSSRSSPRATPGRSTASRSPSTAATQRLSLRLPEPRADTRLAHPDRHQRRRHRDAPTPLADRLEIKARATLILAEAIAPREGPRARPPDARGHRRARRRRRHFRRLVGRGGNHTLVSFANQARAARTRCACPRARSAGARVAGPPRRGNARAARFPIP